MKRSTLFVIVVAVLFGGLAAAQQVATAEFQGVDFTLPHSPGVSGWLADGSVGEARIVVLALDADGNAVAGAPVMWTVRNAVSDVAYVVDASADDHQLATAYEGADLVVQGGVTDADGQAFLVLDSLTAGDLTAIATVGSATATSYDGGEAMRVVWF